MKAPRAHAPWLVALATVALAGCGGGAPLLHPAHVLAPGFVDFAAGVSGRAAVGATASGKDDAALERVSIAPGVSPVVAARIGLQGQNELGLGYYGRSVRLDARHAFDIGGAALSLGLGASAIVPGRPTGAQEGDDVYGAGADLPIIFGARSRSDLYAVWIGARGGFELFRGTLPAVATPAGSADAAAPVLDVDGRHVFGGALVGLRAGFRHLHVAIEVDAAYHHAWGSLGAASASVDGFSITPAGALVASF